jgi:hypothetical protein
MGLTLIASGVISFVFDLTLKRGLLREALLIAGPSQEVKTAGISRATLFNRTDIAWDEMIRGAHKVDLLFAYGRTWRNQHNAALAALAEKTGATVRLLLPDPDDDVLVHGLARRFNQEDEQLRQLIKEAVLEFRSTFAGRNASLRVYFFRCPHIFSACRFDDRVVLALYTHRRTRAGVPVLIVAKPGLYYEYLRDEIEGIVRLEDTREAP